MLVVFGLCCGPNTKNVRKPEPVWIGGKLSTPWPASPIYVSWNEERWGPSHSSAIRRAIRQFPCDMFVEGEGSPQVTFYINSARKPCGEKDPPKDSDMAARAYRCSAKVGEVITQSNAPNAWNPIETYIVAYHELGHEAGLRHDRRYEFNEPEVSIMTPDVLKHSRRIPVHWPSLTDKDRKSLERRYCHAKKR